ncbi:phosphate-starvation-inducible PsiE family protein [Reinekea marinisedimentorum]|uniref:Uncharacterized membrane protein (DUF373 family) n=1 Tax=Reinekea marinisedimentorum TaxID=230495 RepID=A0A4R3IAR4_9GAMM|nr:phosphate-starvation-inducible PsiE family protein [Reinekea marinisedimentorum]TCS42520.1 uncharacterized membrane protein (DUF373 family) [Reinekea marinisedimentorum]
MQTEESELINRLQVFIKVMVKILAVLMTLVIAMGVIDVAWTIVQKLTTKPIMIITVKDLLSTFGAFMAVLIAIEIFVNITIYLRDEVIHVKIVLATALMAVSRKIIILDLDKVTDLEIIGLALVILSLSVGYWMLVGAPSFQMMPKNEKKNELPASPSQTDVLNNEPK